MSRMQMKCKIYSSTKLTYCSALQFAYMPGYTASHEKVVCKYTSVHGFDRLLTASCEH